MTALVQIFAVEQRYEFFIVNQRGEGMRDEASHCLDGIIAAKSQCLPDEREKPRRRLQALQ